MLLMISVFSLCMVALIATLVKISCAHRPDLWFTSDTAILCLVSPAMILLLTFGGTAIGYRLAHGGLAAIPVLGWAGAAAIIVVAVLAQQFLGKAIRRSGAARAA